MVTASIIIAVTVTGVGVIMAFLRWLRVAQREHYLPGSTSRFAIRWWKARPVSVLLALGALLGAALSIRIPLGASVTGLALLFGPVGLTLRGRSAPLVWTRRLRSVAVVAGSLVVVLTILSSVATGSVAPLAVTAIALPVLIDLSLFVLRPLERVIAQRYVRRARQRLNTVKPVVVAITGSYGKTTTKEYVRHLVSGALTVVASPASFNNMAGLCRTVNEHLSTGTEVLVAEVGTYGRGEIREICRWLRPSIGVITALGPVHLERMGSLHNIAHAKSEILETVEQAILNTDYPHLRAIADEVSTHKAVFRCGSSTENCHVATIRSEQSIELYITGNRVATVDKQGIFAGNLASAVAVTLALGVPVEHTVKRLGSLPTPAHRQQVATASNGVRVIDDTYNANPAGAAHALTLMSQICNSGRRVVVSPGMVELGDRQNHENEEFARNAAKIATDILIVGRTNLSSMRKGAQDGKARVQTFGSRDEAVRWVRENLAEGDVVLYENDLPDHFP